MGLMISECPKKVYSTLILGYDILRKHTKLETNHGYSLSNGLVKSREAILSLYKSQIPVDPSKVFINHGVNMGLLNVFSAFVNSGD